MTADPLPRCPHGNEAVEMTTAVPLKHPVSTYAFQVRTSNRHSCVCEVTADTPDRARRAWVALCSAD